MNSLILASTTIYEYSKTNSFVFCLLLSTKRPMMMLCFVWFGWKWLFSEFHAIGNPQKLIIFKVLLYSFKDSTTSLDLLSGFACKKNPSIIIIPLWVVDYYSLVVATSISRLLLLLLATTSSRSSYISECMVPVARSLDKNNQTKGTVAHRCSTLLLPLLQLPVQVHAQPKLCLFAILTHLTLTNS